MTIGKVLSAAFALSLVSLSGAYAADPISATPRVAQYRHAKPVCDRGCKKVRVCDTLIVSSADRTKAVPVCYKAQY